MRDPLYIIARWWLGFLPVDGAGRRVFDETLADWRKEAARASGHLDGIVVSVRAMWSVFRCVVMVSAREIRSREGRASLMRLAAWSIVCMLVFVGIRWNESIVVRGTPVPLGPRAAALLSVGAIVAVVPLIAFLCGAIGRRHPVAAPRLGPALVAGAVTFVIVGWVMPATNQAFRQFVFGLHSNGSIPPGINERSIVELVEMLFTESARRAAFGLNIRLLLVIAVPVMLVIGTTARTLTGWRRVAGSVLPVVVLLLPVLVGLDRYGEVAWWPFLLGAALLTRVLVSGASEHNDSPPTLAGIN